jgi:hypothetical protein
MADIGYPDLAVQLTGMDDAYAILGPRTSSALGGRRQR